MTRSGQPRIAKRRYHQFKKNILNDTPRFADKKPRESSSYKSQAYYQQIFERTRAVKLVIDPDDGQIVDANPAACQFYGYSLEQIKSLRITDINTQPEAKSHEAMQFSVAQKGSNFEFQHRLASGAIRDVAVFSTLLQVDRKNYLYVLIQDITDRKQTERSLRESEALYRLFAHSMPNSGVIMFDTEMRYMLAEGSFLKRFGSVYENIVGKRPQDLFSGDTLNFIMSIYQRALHGESFSYERANPDYVYQANVAPLRNEEGEIIGGLILSRDITEAKRVEAALRESEQRHQSVVATMSEGVVTHGQDGAIQTCNPAAEHILGLSTDQMMGRTSIDPRWRTIHEDGSPFPGETHPAMITLHTGQPCSNVIMGIHKPDNTLCWISINSRPMIRSNETRPYAVVVTLVDITERKQLEDQLVVSEERYRTLVDFAPVGIVETDNRGSIVLSNSKWSALSGITLNDPSPDAASVTIHPDDLAKTQAVNQLMLSTAQPVDNLEYRFLHPDGKVVWVSDSSRSLLDTNGTVRGFIVAITDITERKRLEEELRTNQERLRLITNNIQDLVTQSDAEDRITFASPSSRLMLGYEPDNLIGKLRSDFIHPDAWGKMISTHQKAIQERLHYTSTEGYLRHADGHYINVETVIKFLYDDQFNYLGGIYVTRDITERKHMQELLLQQEKLQTALEKEQELSDLKTHMMQRITHEFRTPLAIIQVSMETLTHYYERLTPDKREAKVATVKNQIRHITDMLDEISLVINSTFMPDHIYRVSTDVSALCRDIAAELSSYFNLPDKYLLDVPETLLATVDPAVLENALFHIMRNAARFSESSAAVIVRLTQLENKIEIRVIDTGIGILPNELSRIFEPFFRGSNIDERSGLGIGLTIAHAAIEAHGGTINIESELGKGTTVIVSLPVSNPLLTQS